VPLTRNRAGNVRVLYIEAYRCASKETEKAGSSGLHIANIIWAKLQRPHPMKYAARFSGFRQHKKLTICDDLVPVRPVSKDT
jgi:hypothetical protein